METKGESNAHLTTTAESAEDKQESSQVHDQELAVDSATTGDNKKQGAYKEIVDWIKAIVFAVVIVAVIRLFLFEPFIVDGESMEPNFHSHERVIVNLLVYKYSEPKFGDVIVLNVPDEGRRFIKRIIGVPGDTIELQGDQLYINNELVNEPFLAEAIAESLENGLTYNGVGISFGFPNEQHTSNIVPEGTYFVLGDNRSNSKDSRSIGFVPKKDIIGRTDVVMWPLDQFEFVKHYN